ncbi:tRNA (adenosine(37)-N6)-dimethylallyltransferase MiaA [Candidatus Nomurabacteria bacterium]|nr:tRNA (adenosine(37)-N6)-dimethylallyltransferase MiaA [Candidatus Nomurabacteria bacterium]
MKSKPKIIVILGQTSTGKSDFAVQMAKEISGEIISADSRQVYKGMDLGTGKITKKEMRCVPHHLLDVANPKKVFTVSDYKKLAEKKIKEIIKRGNVPIICGGTGFYIDAIISGQVFPEVPPNKKLREQLIKKSKEELYKILKKLDKNRAETIDQNNPVRLIRAIEIAQALGTVPKLADVGRLQKYEVLKIGLTLPDELLKERIYKRILLRIKKGMIKEVENLYKKGLSWKRMEELGLEYRYISQYLQGKLTKETMIDKLNIETWHYAKRQKTWFKRDKETIWLNPLNKNEIKSVEKKIKDFLK